MESTCIEIIEHLRRLGIHAYAFPAGSGYSIHVGKDPARLYSEHFYRALLAMNTTTETLDLLYLGEAEVAARSIRAILGLASEAVVVEGQDLLIAIGGRRFRVSTSVAFALRSRLKGANEPTTEEQRAEALADQLVALERLDEPTGALTYYGVVISQGDRLIGTATLLTITTVIETSILQDLGGGQTEVAGASRRTAMLQDLVLDHIPDPAHPIKVRGEHVDLWLSADKPLVVGDVMPKRSAFPVIHPLRSPNCD